MSRGRNRFRRCAERHFLNASKPKREESIVRQRSIQSELEEAEDKENQASKLSEENGASESKVEIG